MRSGEPLGTITPAAAAETGLDVGIVVVAGMTDGCASQIASGAVEPGQWLSVLGTTLVVKGVSADMLHDPAGRIYNHRHPAGYWLPGAASNVGGGVLARMASRRSARTRPRRCHDHPDRIGVLPVGGRGRAFSVRPCHCPRFHGGTPRSDHEHYAATLEGVAYVERLGYDVLRQLGATVGPRILTTGGGTTSAVWNQIRADVLGCTLEVVAEPGAAFGAALLAASASLHPDLATATRQMVKPGAVVDAQPQHQDAYDRGYERFAAACQERGYI